MKSHVLRSIVLLNVLACLPLFADELSPASVAERIAKDEGYQLFHFSSEAARPYQIVARFNGIENMQDIQDIPDVKECIVAVLLGKDHALKAVRVYYKNGSVSMVFPTGHFTEFSRSASKSAEVKIDDPFLMLHGDGGDLQLIFRPRKA